MNRKRTNENKCSKFYDGRTKRQRVTLDIKRKCLELRESGKSRAETILYMRKELNDPNFDIKRSSWSEWKKDKQKIKDSRPHRSKNASYRSVDDPIVVSFEREVVKKVDKWNANINVSLQSIRRACALVIQIGRAHV